MSEQGWRNFLAAQGGSDWVVLHGGATAVFRVQSVVGCTDLREINSLAVEQRECPFTGFVRSASDMDVPRGSR